MFRRKGQQADKDKTERVIGLDRRTREEIVKWNQMIALRFQTWGRHQTSLVCYKESDSTIQTDTEINIVYSRLAYITCSKHEVW